MRPIDADRFFEELDVAPDDWLKGRTVIRILNETSTLDYAPVVHGEWIHDINNLYGCSECLGREPMSHKSLKRFCPNCGAKMDGGKIHEY